MNVVEKVIFHSLPGIYMQRKLLIEKVIWRVKKGEEG